VVSEIVITLQLRSDVYAFLMSQNSAWMI